MMLDRGAFHQKNHVLGDVGRQVRNPLEIPARSHQFHGWIDEFTVLAHLVQPSLEDRAIQRINTIVPGAHRPPEIGITLNERGKGGWKAQVAISRSSGSDTVGNPLTQP